MICELIIGGYAVKKIEMCKLTKARSGANSAIIKQTGENPYHLHSTIDPVQEALEWASYIQLEEYTAYVIIGCGLGYHVRALWDKIPKNSILCVFVTEEELDLGTQGKAKGPLYKLIDKRALLFRASELYDVGTLIANRMIDFDIKKVQLCKYYPAMRMNADYFALCEETLVDLIGEKMAISVNINMYMGRYCIENYWKNIPYIATNPGISNFENIFKGWPCIVVAGGPSLNKNINILKECLPYALVIASGSTMGALHKHGITPHFLVVSDVSLEMFQALDGYCDEHTILLASVEVQPKVVSRYPGRRCFAYTLDDGRNLFQQYLPPTMKLTQTVSVATMAVDFARHCGVEKIIMVGQDLAFTDGKQHADGVETLSYKEDGLEETAGYYGGMVPTEYTFKIVIAYLEAYVKNYNIRFINATEGGAKIVGMEQLPLVEVKNKFLGTMLPIEDKINEIFKDFAANPFELNPLINAMVEYQQQCGNVVERMENYDKLHPNFRMISADEELDVMVEKTQELSALFNEFKNHPAAPTYQVFLNPRLQLLEFYKQDGSHISLIYQFHVEMFTMFQEFINQLHQWINEALNSVEKMNK